SHPNPGCYRPPASLRLFSRRPSTLPIPRVVERTPAFCAHSSLCTCPLVPSSLNLSTGQRTTKRATMDLRSLLNCEASGKDNGRHMQWLARDLKAVKVAIEAVLQRLDEDGFKTTASSPSSAGQRETGYPSLNRHTATDFSAE